MRELTGRLLSRRFYDHPVFLVGASRTGTNVL